MPSCRRDVCGCSKVPGASGTPPPYSTNAPGRRALTQIFTKNIGFP